MSQTWTVRGLWIRDAPMVTDLLMRCPDVKVLVTGQYDAPYRLPEGAYFRRMEAAARGQLGDDALQQDLA